jgi:hypothetical protein
MKTSAALIPVALALAAAVLVSGPRAQAAIKTCQTITTPGSYVLAKDLFPTGDCLVITASSVTIDLNGFSIVGPSGITSTSGILANSGARFTAVRNGSISNFGTCVQLENDGSALVEYLRISSCIIGIVASGIVNSNIVQGADSGGAIQSSGLISGNVVVNSHDGIDVGADSTVIGNTVTNNVGANLFGLRVACPSNVINNTITGYGSDGVSLSGKGCNLADNMIDNAGGPAVRPPPARR